MHSPAGGGDAAGFSVVETLIATVLFAIAFVFFFQMLFSGSSLVQFEGDRRAALKLAQRKTEDLILAGYNSLGDDVDWTSLNLDTGVHPPKQGRTVVIDDMGTLDPADDFAGTIMWVVRDTAWSWSDVAYAGPPVQLNGKVVRLTVAWPEDDPHDSVRLTTILAE